jgi:hypothetical protein
MFHLGTPELLILLGDCHSALWRWTNWKNRGRAWRRTQVIS